MKIEIKSYAKYNEVKITDGCTTIESGFCDGDESSSYAEEFLEALDDILYNLPPDLQHEVLSSDTFLNLMNKRKELEEEL